ncbi:TetR family transcriptional regulator C-terminal domain-containing protein [Kitasatospora sp. NPDC101447]|uniref:TetR family transcriptional regulator C-terminal domain-containing protein n=1 Tax=Kitasatospora sp. NPDC101447 TaxID=3364102 RepID=UPI00380AF06C
MSKKEALTRAAAELLWERGYTGTSPAKVLERAHAGQGSMYHHFSGKAELAVEAMTQMSEELRARAEGALGGEGGAVARIDAFLDLERDPLAGCRLGRLTQDYDVVTDDRLRAPLAEFFDWLDERLTAVLAEGVRTGELRPGTDPVAIAALIMATVQGGYVLARAWQQPEAFQRAVEGVRRVLADLRVHPGQD